MSAAYPTALRSRFSASAGTYEQRASVQAAVAQRLRAFWPEAAGITRILEIGCGTGLLTRYLVRDFLMASVDAQDLSPRMIAQAREALGPRPGLTWHAGDVLTLDLPGPYALIASSSALHWIRPLPDLAARLQRWLAPGGRLVAAVMVRGTLAELLAARARAAQRKPPLAALPTAKEFEAAFTRAGLVVERACQEPLEATYPSARLFLRALNEQGLTAGPFARSRRGLLTRRELDALAAYYDRRYARGSGVYATYQVCYFVARRPA
jgi:malonyl-CoA O-methyltransferase